MRRSWVGPLTAGQIREHRKTGYYEFVNKAYGVKRSGVSEISELDPWMALVMPVEAIVVQQCNEYICRG